MKRSIALGASRTLAVCGFAGWAYIVIVALVEPQTLGTRLTHFTTFPYEDTFGAICFAASLVSFFRLQPAALLGERRGQLTRDGRSDPRQNRELATSYR